MDRRKLIEYLVTTMCVLVTSFVIYGLVGSIEPIIQNSRLKSFLLFGCLGGFGFSMLVSTLILSARFFSNRGLEFKIVAAILWPVTYACAIYVGFFSYIPYQIYNVIKIITESKKNNKGITFEDLTKVLEVPMRNDRCIEIEFMLSNSEKYHQCWMGKGYDKNIDKDTYWFGLTEDGNNAYDYTSFEDMSNAPVFDGKSLKDVWNDIKVISVDGCEPLERFQTYMKNEHKPYSYDYRNN